MRVDFELVSIRRRSDSRVCLGAVLCSALMLPFGASAGAQSPGDSSPPPRSVANLDSLPDAPLPQTGNRVPAGEGEAVTLRSTPIHILKDQEAIWTSPLRMRPHDLAWAAPLLLATGAAIVTDRRAMSAVSHDRTFNHDNVLASDVVVGGFVAAPVLLWGRGQWHGDEHARKAGILGGEALLDGVVVEQGMKLIFWRERPSTDNGRGRFFQSGAGFDSSFPSSHTVLTWSSAAVLAAEYSSPWAQFGIYTLAGGVSLTRVLGQQHFPSDVLVGSAAGWLVGHYVYRRHHRNPRKAN